MHLTGETTLAAWSRPVPIGEVPVAREGHSLTLLDKQLFLFRGYTATGAEVNDLHTYNISEQSWKELSVSGTSPSPRQAHSAVRHGHLVVAGGCGGSVCFSDVWSLDPLNLVGPRSFLTQDLGRRDKATVPPLLVAGCLCLEVAR